MKEFGDELFRITRNVHLNSECSMFSSADEKFDSTMKVNAVVHHNGDVLYVPPGIFKSVCPFNIGAFPFVSFHFSIGNVRIISIAFFLCFRTRNNVL